MYATNSLPDPSFLQWEVGVICIKVDIPQDICDIDDELKAIYHGKDTVCIWVFKTRVDRNRFMDETAGMRKAEREEHYAKYFGS